MLPPAQAHFYVSTKPDWSNLTLNGGNVGFVDLPEHALKHCVDINKEKNFFKSFSTVGICSNRLEILSKHIIVNNEKMV